MATGDTLGDVNLTLLVGCCRMGTVSSSLSSPWWTYWLAEVTMGMKGNRDLAVTGQGSSRWTVWGTGLRKGKVPGASRERHFLYSGGLTHSGAPAWTGWAGPR
jgi:hypothetical protein